MEYKVKINSFEGPLDLLLHLIGQLEIDIHDIPLTEITDQYLAFIHTMQELELNVASEYLVMAATLLAMKSRALLPDYTENNDEAFGEEEDPREELSRRLLEYKKYKDAAAILQNSEEERRLLYTRPPSDQLFAAAEGPLDVSVADLIGAFQKMMRRKKLAVPPKATVRRESVSVAKRISTLREKLSLLTKPILFDELFESEERDEIVVSFLAVLELMKQNEITVLQSGNFQALYVRYGGKQDE